MHYLHDIEPGNDKSINVVVEIAKGSGNKYEVDKETGLIKLDRVLHTAQTFPFDYGFVPRTHWHDGDPLDVVILTTYPLQPGVLVTVRPVAIAHMDDSGDKDDKIIAVPETDPRWGKVKDLQDINEHTLQEIKHFYSTYKNLQNKKVSIDGFADASAARAAFNEGVKLYKDKKK